MINKLKFSLTFLLLALAKLSFAQGPPDYSARCKEEMKKLAYLAGSWKGDAKVRQGPGPELIIGQEEKIEYRLDGTLLVIEGTGRDAHGNIVFNALGLLNYDAPNEKLIFKSYMKDGRSADAYFTVLEDNKYEWGFDIPGRGKSKYTIVLDPKEKSWHEKGEYSSDGNNWFTFIELNLKKVE
jgi:hypothetical protein